MYHSFVTSVGQRWRNISAVPFLYPFLSRLTASFRLRAVSFIPNSHPTPHILSLPLYPYGYCTLDLACADLTSLESFLSLCELGKGNNFRLKWVKYLVVRMEGYGFLQTSPGNNRLI